MKSKWIEVTRDKYYEFIKDKDVVFYADKIGEIDIVNVNYRGGGEVAVVHYTDGGKLHYIRGD